MKLWVTTLFCGALMGASYPLAQKARPIIEAAPVALTQAEQKALEEKAQASLFGQVRGSLSDFLYMQVDRYVHSGVSLRGMTNAEKELAARQNTTHVSNNDSTQAGMRQHSSTETTVVPARERDWRGIFGEIQRQTQPYMNMKGHTHKSPQEALSLYRLMTLSNPNFTRAYTEGAWVMSGAKGIGLEGALAFLEEGARHNPNSIDIYSNLGALLMHKLHRFPEGQAALERAIALGKTRDPSTLSTDESEAFQSAFRYLVNGLRNAGRKEEARRRAIEGLTFFPKDVTCRKFLKEE